MYDVFISYAHKDQLAVRALAQSLSAEGLRVFIDETEVGTFSSIQSRVEQGIAKSKVLLAWYSTNYTNSRPCQWELSAAYLCDSGERVLVVNPEASMGHIQPRSLLDRVLIHSSDLAEVVRKVKEETAKLTDAIGDSFARRPRPFGFQPIGSNRFVGRVPELWAINDGLKRSASPMLSGVARSIVQIRGLGGIGKSLLAEEFALRFGAAFPGGIFWLKAFGSDSNKSLQDREAERRQQVTEFAAQIPLPVESRSFQEIWAMLADELKKNTCLWVVDDLPSGLTREQLSIWYSPHPSVPTLMTIPDLSHDDLGVLIDLDALTEDEALDLLRAHKLENREGEGAASLVEAVGRHPLAIEIAASYIRFRNGAVSCADFAEELRTATRDQLEFAAKVRHAAGLAPTLSAALAQLSTSATDLILLASVLASAPVPANLINAVFRRLYDCSPEEAELMRLEASSETDRFALSRFDPVRPEARRVHTLIARYARLHAASAERVAQIRAAAVAGLTEELEATSYAKLFRLGLESTHARQLSVQAGDGAEIGLLVLVGAFDLIRGDFASAERISNIALDYCNRSLPGDEDYRNRAKGLLAQVCIYRGDFSGARALLEPVVAIVERLHAPGNLYRLGAKVSLAMVLSMLGELEAARRLAENAVAESLSANGLQHPTTLSAKTILSQVSAMQGNNAQAVELMSQVVASRRQQAAEGDPDLLLEEFHLIKARGIASGLHESEPVIAKAIDVFTEQYGAENILTLQVRLYQLVALLQKGQTAEAQCRLHELITMLDRVLGPTHPLVLQARAIRALSLFAERKYNDARAQIEPLVAQLEAALSPHHPEVIDIKFSLATAVLESGDYGRASDLLQHLLTESETYLGKEHPHSVASRCALISCLTRMDRLSEAREAWDELMELTYARANPSTYTCGVGIAQALMERKDAGAAQEILQKLVPQAEAQFGRESQIVVTAKMGLALNAQTLGQLDEAVRWWQQVLSANDCMLGKDHPNTTRTAFSLFLVCWRMGRYDECYKIFNERFLLFCAKEIQTLDETQREILSCIRRNTPWLPNEAAEQEL